MPARTYWPGAMALTWMLGFGCSLQTQGHEPAPTSSPGAGPTKPPAGTVLRIGDRVVSTAEFARLLGPPPQRRGREPEPQRRRSFLADLERTELLALEAQRRGVLAQSDVQKATRSLLVERMLADLFGTSGSELAPVTDADVRAYYEAHLEDFSSKERVRAGQIVVRDRIRALALLSRLRASPKNPALFAELAASDSLDPDTRARGGDLGLFTRTAEPGGAMDALTTASMRMPVVPEAVREAAFALVQPGDLTETPIKSADGYHIVQLWRRQAASRFELPQVSRMIRDQLFSERQSAALTAFTARLQAEAHLQIDESKLPLLLSNAP